MATEPDFYEQFSRRFDHKESFDFIFGEVKDPKVRSARQIQFAGLVQSLCIRLRNFRKLDEALARISDAQAAMQEYQSDLSKIPAHRKFRLSDLALLDDLASVDQCYKNLGLNLSQGVISSCKANDAVIISIRTAEETATAISNIKNNQQVHVNDRSLTGKAAIFFASIKDCIDRSFSKKKSLSP